MISDVECPRCGSFDTRPESSWKKGNKKINRRTCCGCDYMFSVDNPTMHQNTRNTKLKEKQPDLLIEDAIQFGLIKKVPEDKFEITPLGRSILSGKYSPSKCFYNIPVFNYLIKTIGNNPSRCDFESAMNNSEFCEISLQKRNWLWNKYVNEVIPAAFRYGTKVAKAGLCYHITCDQNLIRGFLELCAKRDEKIDERIGELEHEMHEEDMRRDYAHKFEKTGGY